MVALLIDLSYVGGSSFYLKSNVPSLTCFVCFFCLFVCLFFFGNSVRGLTCIALCE